MGCIGSRPRNMVHPTPSGDAAAAAGSPSSRPRRNSTRTPTKVATTPSKRVPGTSAAAAAQGQKSTPTKVRTPKKQTPSKGDRPQEVPSPSLLRNYRPPRRTSTPRGTNKAAPSPQPTPPPTTKKTPEKKPPIEKTPTPESSTSPGYLYGHIDRPIPTAPTSIKPRNPDGARRLQAILDKIPPGSKNPNLVVTSAIGEGTFSTVYLGKPKNSAGGEASASKADGEVALKHLIPTSSPERVLMEVDCLRIAQGRHNVMPLLFCHRVGGDVILGMPVIRPAKFGELIRVVAMKEMLTYMKRLLEALAHIHKLKILHRDIKPANFLYNRQHQQFGLVDFGLAQQMGQATPEKKEQFTSRKRIGSSDLGGQCSPEKSYRPQLPRDTSGDILANISDMSKDMPGHDEAENKTRDALTNATNNPEVFQAERDRRVQEFRQRAQEVSSDVVDESPPSGQQHSYNHKKAFSDHYQSKRGYVKKSPAESFAERRMAYMVDENVLAKHKESKKKEDRENWKQSKTPTKKSLPNILERENRTEVRRSPRKHNESRTGFSSFSIVNNSIVGAIANRPATLTKSCSFTMLEPQSGLPTDQTPTLHASVTSRNSGNSTVLFKPSMAPVNVKGTRIITPKPLSCKCFGQNLICHVCNQKPKEVAARAGTPGFRPPEVLLKSKHQTTAVDVWAAGIMMLCMISRTYPFFKSPDDMTALAEMMTIFGTDRIMEVAASYKKKLVTSENCPGIPLKILCSRLVARSCAEPDVSSLVSKDTIDLLEKLLHLNAHERISAKEALEHPIFQNVK